MTTLEGSSSNAHLTAATMAGLDPVGIVFFKNGRVLRGIRADKADETNELLASGLIQRLADEGLFPATEIVDDNLPGFAMTLEHRRLHPLVLPSEWSFGMLHDAALGLLKINRIARSFGYETKDAHLYNLAFVGTQPVFFDFGSFARIGRSRAGWIAYDEFVRGVLYPLALASQGGATLTRMLLDHMADFNISHEDYLRLRAGGMARWFPWRTLARARTMYGKLLSVGGWPDAKFNKRMGKRQWMRRALDRLRNSPFFEVLTADIDRLEARVRRIGAPQRSAFWSNYQQQFFDVDGGPVLNARLQRLCELVTELKPGSILELGGNMGAFSLALQTRGVASQITCTDADEGAVENAYRLFKRHGGGVCTAAVVDVLRECRSVKVPSFSERYRAEVVVALALTHHLILSQGVQGELLMRRIAAFCTRYSVVEFMPLGLSDGTPTSPVPPVWYTLDWFRQHFLAQFDLLREERLEENRVVLVGRKR